MKNGTNITSLEGISTVYFIGIGGIGMSAIARYFKSRGVSVSGYDKTQTNLTKELEAEGISIHYSEDTDSIPKDAGLVVYTPAVPKEHAELVYYQENGYPVVKRSDVLQAITGNGDLGLVHLVIVVISCPGSIDKILYPADPCFHACSKL